MTIRSNATATAGSHGNFDYMQLLSEFQLVLKNFAWMDDALCRHASGVDFFPDESYNRKAPEAIAVCNVCPVKRDCLNFAMTNGIDHGIWGGTNGNQRKRMKRAREKQK